MTVAQPRDEDVDQAPGVPFPIQSRPDRRNPSDRTQEVQRIKSYSDAAVLRSAIKKQDQRRPDVGAR